MTLEQIDAAIRALELRKAVENDLEILFGIAAEISTLKKKRAEIETRNAMVLALKPKQTPSR